MGRLKKGTTDKARAQSLDKLTTKEPKGKGKAGRPKGGKRDDEAWLARSFFLESEVDGLIDEVVYLAKRRQNKIDKSDVVNTLVKACLQYRLDGNTESLTAAIQDIQPSHTDPIRDIAKT